VTIQANLDGLPIAEAAAAVQAKAAAIGLPPDYTLTATGNAKTQAETDSNFGTAFGLAFLLMYMILAAQYESLVHPITILLSVPLTVPFALMSLWLLGQPMDLFSMFGIFMLFGIVKKNGILQVDATNQLRAAGLDRDAAILEANHVRLRPILMTTVMLVAGMIPVAMGEGPGAGARASMAKVIVGGQALSLLLTLLIVPVGYSLFDDVGRIAWWLRTKLFGGSVKPEPPPPPTEPEPAAPPGA
jgi:HAE1 family hydrophobic/amphiphilic exporter-1